MGIWYNEWRQPPTLRTVVPQPGGNQPPFIGRQIAAMLAAVVAAWPQPGNPHPAQLSTRTIAPQTLSYGQQPIPAGPITPAELASIVAQHPSAWWPAQNATPTAAIVIPPVVSPHVAPGPSSLPAIQQWPAATWSAQRAAPVAPLIPMTMPPPPIGVPVLIIDRSSGIWRPSQWTYQFQRAPSYGVPIVLSPVNAPPSSAGFPNSIIDAQWPSAWWSAQSRPAIAAVAPAPIVSSFVPNARRLPDAAIQAWSLEPTTVITIEDGAPFLLVDGDAPPVTGAISSAQRTVLRAWDPPFVPAQSAAPNAGWNVPIIPSTFIANAKTPAHAYAASVLGWSVPPSSARIAPLIPRQGDQPAPIASLSASAIAIIGGQWPAPWWDAQHATPSAPTAPLPIVSVHVPPPPPPLAIVVQWGTWDAQRQAPNAAWNVAPPDAPPPRVVPPQSIYVAWLPEPWRHQQRPPVIPPSSGDTPPIRGPIARAIAAEISAIWVPQEPLRRYYQPTVAPFFTAVPTVMSGTVRVVPIMTATLDISPAFDGAVVIRPLFTADLGINPDVE